MQSEVAWVFGGSAAGKETFIRHVVEMMPAELLERLGWKDRSLVICSESIEWVAQYPGDPLGDKRRDLLKVIPQLAERHAGAVILVKGQDLDLGWQTLRALRKKLPDDSHRIIFIDGDAEEQYERWKKKPWFESSYTVQTVRWQVGEQIASLRQLRTDFPITSIHGGRGQKYAASVFLP